MQGEKGSKSKKGHVGFCPACGSVNVVWDAESDTCHCNACYWSSDSEFNGVEIDPIRKQDIATKIAELAGAKKTLLMLQEECAELIQAASKVIRTSFEGYIDAEEAQKNLQEEIADVLVCLEVLGEMGLDATAIRKIMEEKAERWLNRLNTPLK